MLKVIFLVLILAACTQQVQSGVDAIIIVDESCPLCLSMNPAVEMMQQEGVQFNRVMEVSYNTNDGRLLVERNNITRIPAILLSDELSSYPDVAKAFEVAGIKSNEEFFVIESPPVYRDTKSGEIRGMVNLTMLYDQTCIECFDVRHLKNSLSQLGLLSSAERLLDINSQVGSQLVSKYNITKVPTILLQGDLQIYDRINQAFINEGSIESDGTYILRNISSLGEKAVYKDLKTSSIVRP